MQHAPLAAYLDAPELVCRRRRRAGLVGASAMAIVIALCGVSRAQQLGVEPRRFRESVTLDADSAVAKKLGTIREYFAAEQWQQGIDMLRQVVTDSGDSLVSVTPGRYLNVALYCNTLLANLPPEGLEAFRRASDPQARQWYEQALQTRDPAPLERIVRQAFASSYGDEALNRLAEWAWEAGEFSAARSYWTQLIPIPSRASTPELDAVLRYPDTDLEQPAILARLVLCSLAEGNWERAAREWQSFRSSYPQAEGSLSGRSGNLAEMLEELAQSARDWDLLPRDPSVATFALNARRNKVLPEAVDVGTPQWSVDLPRPLLREAADEPWLVDRRSLSFFPVVLGDLVFANGADRILAWNLLTGEPAWPAEEAGAVVYPTLLDEAPLLPSQRAVGSPHFTMTIHEGRLYAKMGSPISGVATRELRDLQSDLVCLDIAQRQGQVVWKRSAAEFQGLAQDWMFEGSPVVGGGRLYVGLRRSRPNTQLNVACLDAATGKLIWNKPVCAVVGELAANENVVSHHLLTLADNTIYYATHQGAVAALDAADGTLRWVVTYETQSADRRVPAGPLPCLFDRGVVYAAPLDADGVIAIDALTGIVKWNRSVTGGIAHLLGVGGGQLIVSGNDLWGINTETGQAKKYVGYSNPAGIGYGRGVLAEDLIYWPTRTEIFIVHQATGKIVRRVALEALHDESGGNLTIANGYLLIAQADRLVAFCEYGQLKKQADGKFVDNADSPHGFLQLARAEQAVGDVGAARAAYERAQEYASPRDVFNGRPIAEVAAGHLRELCGSREPHVELERVAASTVSGHMPKHDGGRQDAEENREVPSDFGTSLPLPLREVWERKLTDGEVAVLPQGVGTSASRDCWLVDGPVLSCVERSDSATRWSLPAAAPLDWAGDAGGNFILCSRHGIRAVAPGTGELVWERSCEPRAKHSYDSDGERLYSLDDPDRFTAVNGADGTVAWKYEPAAGRLQGRWFCDDRHVVLQQMQPDRTLVLDAGTGRLAVDLPGFSEPWARRPVRIDSDRIALISARREIRSMSFNDPESIWSYAGPLSYANADPVVAVCRGVPHVVVDGDTLVQLDARSGEQRWRRSFSRSPVPDADELVSHDETHVYAAGDGILRSFALKDGQPAWEHYLGNSRLRWRAVMSGDYVAAYPTTSPKDGEVVLVACDRRTGQRVQRIVFLDVPAGHRMRFSEHETTPLVLVGNRVIGLGQFPLTPHERHEQVAGQTER